MLSKLIELRSYYFRTGSAASNAPLSVTASFFDLGGDSLKAGQLVNAIRKAMRFSTVFWSIRSVVNSFNLHLFRIQLSVADLFISPTIEKMAIKVNTQKALGSSPSPFIRHADVDLALSPDLSPFGQKRASSSSMPTRRRSKTVRRTDIASLGANCFLHIFVYDLS